MAYSRMLPDTVLTAIAKRPETTTAFDALKARPTGMSPEDQAQLAELIGRLQAPHLAAQTITTRDGERPYADIALHIGKAYLTAYNRHQHKDTAADTISPSSPPAGSPGRPSKDKDTSIATMITVNDEIWGSDIVAQAYQDQEYTVKALSLAKRDQSIAGMGEGSSDSAFTTSGQQHADEIAAHLWKTFKAQCTKDPDTVGQVVLSVLGNNSAEGVSLASWVFKALIRKAVTEAPELIETLLQHILFLNTGAAGKGAEHALVNGVAVQFEENTSRFSTSDSAVNSLRILGFTVNDDGSLPDQTHTISARDAHTTQFNCAENVELHIKGGKATAFIPDTTSSGLIPLYKDLPIRASGGAAKPGLLLGRTEAETNEHLEHGLVERWLASPDFKTLATILPHQDLASLIRSNLRIVNEINSVNTGQNATFGAIQIYWQCIKQALMLDLDEEAATYIMNQARGDLTQLKRNIQRSPWSLDIADQIFANTMQVSIQKQQQSERTATTMHTQHANPLSPEKPGFAISIYASPIYAPENIVLMPPDQLAMHLISFLKEFWTVQGYILEGKNYHAPMPFDPEIYAIYIKLSSELRTYWQTPLESSHDLTDIHADLEYRTLAGMRDFFNQTAWPACEKGFPVAGTPKAKGLTTERSLLLAMLPTLVRTWQTKRSEKDTLRGFAHGTCLSVMETKTTAMEPPAANPSPGVPAIMATGTPPTGPTASPDSPPVVAV